MAEARQVVARNRRARFEYEILDTFEAGIAETDERVKLWIDNSLIIDRWETYDYLSATTFSACGPFCPWVTSIVTFCPSFRVLNPSIWIAV